jgi:hypothetical protein
MTQEHPVFRALRGIRKIVINNCHGGFSLSAEAERRYRELAGITDSDWSYYDIARDDPYLVQVVQELGEDADGSYAKLKIVEVPADVGWHIADYDCLE